MIASLEDAWRWYDCVRTLAKQMDRLGEHFWDRPELATLLGQDNHFRHLESDRLRQKAEVVLDDLKDLGVLLMFSVFEAIVRDRARADIRKSLPDRLHPAVESAINGLEKDIESGSFGKVTEAFKRLDHNLIEEVNQVRRYRNWVAHGRRGTQPDFVTPEAAYRRLSEFLSRMDEAATPGPDLTAT